MTTILIQQNSDKQGIVNVWLQKENANEKLETISELGTT